MYVVIFGQFYSIRPTAETYRKLCTIKAKILKYSKYATTMATFDGALSPLPINFVFYPAHRWKAMDLINMNLQKSAFRKKWQVPDFLLDHAYMYNTGLLK